MDVFAGLSDAFAAMQSWQFLIAFVVGCLNGVLFGAIPGLSGSVGIALMIPFTSGMDPAAAMAIFVAALSGQSFSGSITAILINVPGSSPSAATTFDGYPLARQGKGGFAIGISAAASFFGSVIGTIVLVGLIPVVRSVVLAFSFPELALMGILGLTVIAMVARGSMVKGLLSGLLGVVVSFVGFAPVGGQLRYVFGQPALSGGIDVVIALVGMYAVAEGLHLLSTNQSVAKDVANVKLGRGEVWEGVKYTAKQPGLVVRSSLVGTAVGVVPAVGGTVAAFLAYFQAAKTVKNPKFGQGDPRGVLAPEASNDAKDSGSALPTLAFGIPGSADWAIILGAMTIHGIVAGPNLLREHSDVVWIAIMILIGASFVSSLTGFIFAPQLMKITQVRPALLSPIVIMLAVVGAFALHRNVADVLASIVFGLLAYAMRRVGIPLIPLILGLILGTMVERYSLQTIASFGWSGFVNRPIALVLVLIIVAVILYEVYAGFRTSRRNPELVREGVRRALEPASLVMVALFGGIGVFGFVVALGFSENSREFPLVVTGVLAGLAGLYLLIALVPPLRRLFPGFISDGGSMEDTQHQYEAEAEELVGPEHQAAIGADPATAAAGTVVDTQDETDPEQESARRRRLRLSIILVALIGVGTLVVGLPIAIPLVLAAFVRLVSRESWRMTIIVTVLTSALLYFAFVYLLNVPMRFGMLPF